MPDTLPRPGTGDALEINTPLSAATIHRLAAAATAHRPRIIVDHGGGWGAMLLACLEQAPGAHGTGIDIHEPDSHRAREAAAARGLQTRAEFVVGPSADHDDAADLLINLGAFHAFGSIPDALSALRARRADGGRLLFGCEYWASTPTADELASMWPDASQADCLTLPEIVETAHAAGWHLLDLHDSTRQELDAFDLGHLRPRTQWLARHPDHPEREALLAEVTGWLHGHRRSMGFVTLLLG